MGEIINVFINRSLASIKHPSPSETLGWGPADLLINSSRTHGAQIPIKPRQRFVRGIEEKPEFY